MSFPVPFKNKPFIFNSKTTSASRDLFYYYDAISHFQDKEGEKDIREFLSLSGLGLAILQSHGRERALVEFKFTGIKKSDKEFLDDVPMSSVVLIDEIDKAPRDFPNDLLNEIDNMSSALMSWSKEK